MENNTHTFLALGDSYTIGEAVSTEDRWPSQLVKRLREKGITIADPQIIATTGWTTDELQKGILVGDVKGTFSIVSLLIGVNNQYRGYPLEQYKDEFKELLDQAIAFADGNAHNVFVISIPDYGVTPFVEKEGLDPEKIKVELDEYNALAERITLLRDAHFVSITEGSRDAKDDLELVASDGLHPSGKMYGDWVDALFEEVYRNLSTR